jgi:ectoine hydroxylase-related dioxygenase (phytanoyl-CoA dioxygenase family)
MTMGTSTQPLRPITDDEVEAFWRDGVVCLRGVMPPDWLERMAGPVEDALVHPTMTDLSSMGDGLAAAGADLLVDQAVAARPRRGHFLAGTDHWTVLPEFRAFALESPLGAIVAALLRSDTVRLYEDSVLVKEPGTAERTAFHQDLAYFHLDGTQICTTWVPLDPVTAETGAVQFVVGSHLRQTRYRPNFFVTTMSMPDTDGDEVPDYDTHPGDERIASFDTEPGDITVHHARTIHGAFPNTSAHVRRRAISVRFAGDDARFRIRRGAPQKPHHAGLVEGQALTEEACPLAHTGPAANSATERVGE